MAGIRTKDTYAPQQCPTDCFPSLCSPYPSLPDSDAWHRNAFTVSMANAVSLEPHRMLPSRCVRLLICHQSACALKMSPWEAWGSLRMLRFGGSSSLQTWYFGIDVHPRRKSIKSQGLYLNSMYSNVFSHSQREAVSVGRSWTTSLGTIQD